MIFKIGDTIKVVSRLYDDSGIALNISNKIIRSVLKPTISQTEIVGVVTKLDDFTVLTVFDTSTCSVEKYRTDIRFSENGESFSTPVIIFDIVERVS